VGFEVFTALMFQVKVFWVVLLHSAVVGYQHFWGPCYLHLHHKNGGSIWSSKMSIFYHNTTWCHNPDLHLNAPLNSVWGPCHAWLPTVLHLPSLPKWTRCYDLGCLITHEVLLFCSLHHWKACGKNYSYLGCSELLTGLNMPEKGEWPGNNQLNCLVLCCMTDDDNVI
jgi:hypothetical protein